jgi:hypothetical protein
MFDPTKPANGAPNSSAEMRAQLTALFDLIPKAATLDGVATLPPGSSAGATVSLDSGGTLHFSFQIPQGANGEVSTMQLNDAIATAVNQAVSTAQGASSNNSNAVAELGISPSDPDLSVVVQKLNELIQALRR